MDSSHALEAPWRTAARATWIGALCGVRSLVPLSHLARQHERAGGAGGPWSLLARWPVRALLRASMMTELVVDKLPGVPSRLAGPAIAGRLVSGAVGGAAVYAAVRRRPLVGALLGALAAYGGAVVAHRLRVGEDAKERPHVVRGVIEDAFVVSAASRAAQALPFTNHVMA